MNAGTRNVQKRVGVKRLPQRSQRQREAAAIEAKSKHRVVILGIIGVLVVVATVLAIVLFWIPANAVRNHIASQLTRPSVLDRSRVLVGDPASFAWGGFLSAKLKITGKASQSLLDHPVAFNDCTVRGRTCSSSPTWAKFDDQLGFTSLSVPRAARCAQSYKTGSQLNLGVHMICVDTTTKTLYYYSWSDDSH
jgi:hypothetical protein